MLNLCEILLNKNYMPNRVIHFEIQADDVDRAKRFYEKVFDWKIEQAMTKEKGGMDYWTLSTGESGEPGISGGMYERPKDRAVKTYNCTILVEDIDKAIEVVKKNGGKIEIMEGKEKNEMKEIGWFARAKDTEGNIFGLMQATKWKPK